MTEPSNKSLVEALEQLGAKYPMKRSGLSAHSIKGQKNSFKVTIVRMLAASTFRAIISGGKLENGIELTLDGEITYSVYQNDLGFVK
jgi:hypothetical protein